MKDGEGALVIFVKVPIEGRVKTRLVKSLSASLVTDLYRCFVADTLAMARNTEYPIFIYYDPPDGAQAVAEWLGDGLLYFPQVGADLGERMFHAFEVVLQKFSRAVLIGSDSPDLPDSLISQAFNVLKTHDAVVGPAADGGYYLIGFSNEGICEAPFGDIQWGTSGVFDVTMAAFRMSRKDVHVLPLWHDIDEYDDLVSFYERQKWQPSGGPATIDFLRNRLGW